MTPTLSPFAILLNARRIQAVGFARQPNWVIAAEMFNVGHSSAVAICNNAGIDHAAYNITLRLPVIGTLNIDAMKMVSGELP
jgi:hypothetical protein